jgi:hypothetical protein
MHEGRKTRADNRGWNSGSAWTAGTPGTRDLAEEIDSQGVTNATETYLFDAPTFMKVP